MKTFSITTLGCRVNHYESEQLATLLRGRGLVPAASAQAADLRVVHTCSVTVQAASKSRQAARRATRLAVLNNSAPPHTTGDGAMTGADRGANPVEVIRRATATRSQSSSSSSSSSLSDTSSNQVDRRSPRRPRVVVTGCWASSHPTDAARLPGVDAVLGHSSDVGLELSRLLTQWEREDACSRFPTSTHEGHVGSGSPGWNEGWMMQQAGAPAGLITHANEPQSEGEVNGKLESDENACEGRNEGETRSQKPETRRDAGMVTLPLLGERQTGHQRAFLKVQDGCDAHCTYCIIPQLRPRLWSKGVEEAVEEARRLVEAGHVEIVLTGIFLGAYGQGTALRRRQAIDTAEPLGALVEALCTRVAGLGRLRLSSLEPGDLTERLIDQLKSHRQVVPHFHLPLQSGSDFLLRRMNRQYGREDFLAMVERVKAAFDRPAITTDIIVGFPGESDAEFERTVEVVERVGFVHVHAFSYSPRPNTAAARWARDFVRGPVVNRRIDRLKELSVAHSLAFRRWFVGEEVEVLVERPSGEEQEMEALAGFQHGRCERYFAVHFASDGLAPGTVARVRADRVTPARTFGALVGVGR
jgi:MiaB/RimO family radical SAM methylthiotransferase